MGAFLANLGAALFRMGDLDRASITFWSAAEADKHTYGTSPGETFALSQMFVDFVGARAFDFGLKAAKGCGAVINEELMEELSQFLGVQRYAFMAYLYVGWIHESEHPDVTTEFGHLQKLNVLRSLTVLLESELRLISRASSGTFYNFLIALKKRIKTNWFREFETRKRTAGVGGQTPAPVETQFRKASGRSCRTAEEMFCRDLLVAYIIHNFSAHRADISPCFVHTDFARAVGHIVSAMICLLRYK